MSQIEEYVKRIMKVLIYIEENLEEEMTLEELAKLSCYSTYHFHRIFQGIVGEPVHSYIKRLKLERAAGQLRYGNRRITDIALDANYETPSAFTKAFKQHTGKSPIQYRSYHAEANRITQKIKELAMIKPDVIEKNRADIPLLFIRKVGNYGNSASEAWKCMYDVIDINHLDRSSLRYFGIAHDDPAVTTEDKLRYDAAIHVKSPISVKGELGHQTLKGGKYATFTHHGSYETLNDTFDKIFLKWLPLSNEKYDESRSVYCEYLHIELKNTHPDKLVTKINIPLV